jgi:AcrR family transcriptional regulator
VSNPVTAPDASGPRRRIPKQARARERVERILDAARAELEGRPATDITIESIAERAGVAVGSVYSYFSSKTALLLAVAATVMDEADAETARQLVECRNLPWREAVDRTVEATLGVLRDSPDYRQLLRTIRFTPEFAEVTTLSNDRVADMTSLHPAFGRAGIDRHKAQQICRTVMTAANALQDRALADEQLDFEALLEETKRLVTGYLGTYLP